MKPTFLTRKELAERLKVSTRTIERWSKRGLLTPIKIAGIVRYDENEINALAPSQW